MNRSELVRRLAQAHPELTQHDMERIVRAMFEEITVALIRGDRVELRNFGNFFVRERGPRRGRNPRTGDTVDIPVKRVPRFKVGKGLRDRVDTDQPNVTTDDMGPGTDRRGPSAHGG